MDPNPALGAEAPANTLTWIKAVMAAAVILPLTAFAGLAWYAHGQAINAATLQIDRSARVAEEHARAFFETNGNGTIGGVLSTRMARADFHKFYRELSGDNRLLNIELVRDDGAILASWPNMPAEGNPLSALVAPNGRATGRGVFRATMRDGRSGLAATRDLAPFGVRTQVWMNDAAVLTPWYREIALLGSLLLAVAAGLVAIAGVALQKTRSALAAVHDMREDIARRRRVEELLTQTQKLEAVGRLTGGVAHDFNNLLMIIGNSVFLHRRAHPPATEDRYLAAIERAVGTGSNLTRQLLSFSRRQSLRPESLRLQERLPPMVDLIRTAVGSGVTIHVDIDPDTGPVFVDPAELELALMNLSINAKDAMVTGGTLRISVGNLAPESSAMGGFVIIRVEDNGIGIPAALLERVFEPLFTTKPAGQGTGLGLSQVHGFCAAAGGSATVQSEVGHGTTVTMLLPFASAPPVS